MRAKRNGGGLTLEFVLMSIVPIAALLLLYMTTVLIGGIKAADEAAREGARVYARYYTLKPQEVEDMAREAAQTAYEAKAPPGSQLKNVTFSRTPGVTATYQNMTVRIDIALRAPFVGEQPFSRQYTFPLETYRRKEVLW